MKAPTKVVYSTDHLQHDIGTGVEWGVVVGAYDVSARAEVIRSTLAADPASYELIDPQRFSDDQISAVHDPGLVRFLRDAWERFQAVRPQREVYPDTFLHPSLRAGMTPLSEPVSVQGALGYWCWETMTPLAAGTFFAARSAVNVALTATDAVLSGDRLSYALCRPPGHHAAHASYGGYCYFNNAAICAQRILAETGAKVSIIDVDYHHGNGTQQIFYERDDVQYVSLHGDPARAYPYLIGFADEIGSGRGRGYTQNFPLGPKIDDAAYARVLDHACQSVAAFDPEVIVVSLGVDTFTNDPLGDFDISTDGFEQQGLRIAALGRPVVVVQEGGYCVPALGANVQAFLRGARREL